VIRDGKEVDLTIKPKKLTRNLLGLRIATYPSVYMAAPEFPAFDAGVRRKDNIVGINGVKLPNLKEFQKALEANNGKTITLEVERDGKELSFSMKAESEVYQIGIAWQEYRVFLDPFTQIAGVFEETFQTFGAIANRSVNISGLSGPLGIGQGIYNQVKFGGWRAGLAFIFMINISLAIFNLLPLPVLDGGHIFIGILEIVSRKRMPASILQPITMIFVLFFFGLMIYVTMNDVKRTGFEIIEVRHDVQSIERKLC
jgi:regulator of sigma E protease